MALGTIVVDNKTETPSGPVRFDQIHFPGDGAYGAGGTVGFQALVRTKLGVGNVEILTIIPGDCGGYVPVYDKANDKLKVFEGNYDAADGPLQETATANLSGVTFNVTVISR
jgi:hypothetical protein